MVHETRSRHRGDGGATGQPSRGTAGLDLRRTCPRIARRACPLCPELIAGSVSKKHPKTPGFPLRKIGRRRRQGGLRRKAHPEHLPAFTDIETPPGFPPQPRPKGPASPSPININGAITPWRDAVAEQTPLPRRFIPFRWAVSTPHPDRGWKPLAQRSSSQSLQIGEKDGPIRGGKYL